MTNQAFDARNAVDVEKIVSKIVSIRIGLIPACVGGVYKPYTTFYSRLQQASYYHLTLISRITRSP